MFDVDKWQEILATIRKNKLRTTLTAAGVFWGMFMLLLMLGFGKGLERGITRNMTYFATNAVYVWGQRTSMPHQGLPPGRRLKYTNDDIDAIANGVEGIEYLAPRNQLGGWRDGNNVSRGAKTGNFGVMGDYPEFQYIQPQKFVRGRFINPIDMQERRKVAVIGKQVFDVLFRPDDDPIGEYIKVQGVYFQVVGVFESPQTGDQGERASQTIHIPFTTFQQAFNYGNRVNWFAITGKQNVSGKVLEERVRAVIMARHKIHPDDRQAIGSFNAEKEFHKVTTLFDGIRYFVWFVGIMTLLAGVIGVSNIMLIVVKERTKELGIRKALGAQPSSIISLILQESVVLTSLAGYAGLVAGVGILELIGWAAGPDNKVFGNPQIDLHVAIFGAVILVVSGAAAGIFPARHAVRINPVEALRAE